MKLLHHVPKALLIALILSVILSFSGFSGQCRSISDQIVRLHVLAHSDSDTDQELKLKVRDRILKEAQDLLEAVGDKQQALQQLAMRLPSLQAAAEEEIAANGFDYSVTVSITNMYFPTREYDHLTLPAGTYDALRITIGSGQGKNWWCVVFPPMCLSAAVDEHRASVELDAVLTEDELEIVEDSSRYEVRFKLVEWFESARQWLLSTANAARTQSVSYP